MATVESRSVAQLLREFREAKGLSVRKAAAFADLDPSTLSRIENARRPPTEKQLQDFARIYERPLDELLAAQAYTEIKQKYGQSPFFRETLQLLNEDAETYGKI